MSYILYFPFALCIFSLYFLPGFLLTKFKIFNKYDEIEKLTLSFLFSSLIFGFIGLFIHLLGAMWNLWTNLIPIIFLILVLGFFVRKELTLKKEGKLFLCIFFVYYILLLTFQIFIRYHFLGTDWISHFDNARKFLSKEWFLSAERTPLYNFIVGYFLSIFGDSYWIAQIISTLVSILFLFPSYLIARELFNKKIAWPTFLMLLISPFFIATSIYGFSKNLTAFFVLICYYFIFKRKLNLFFGLSAALAFLTHQYSLLYLVPFGLFILIKRKDFKLIKQKLFVITFPFLVASLLWYGYNFQIYGEIAPTTFKYYPIAIKGWRELPEKTSEQILQEFWSYPIYIHLFVRAVNFAYTFIPLLPVAFQIISKICSPIVISLTYKVVDFSQLHLTFHFLQTIPGATSLLLYFFFSIGFFKLIKEKVYKKHLIVLILMPIIFSLIQFGFIHPIARLVMEPLIPIFIMIGFWSVFKTKNPQKWVKLIFLFAMIELVLSIYLYIDHINFFTQQLIEWGEYEKYEKYISAYKLFRGY